MSYHKKTKARIAVDNYIKTHNQVFYYNRYVDDIIIFIKDDKKFNLENIKSKLPKGLKINKQKTEIFRIQCRCSVACVCTGNCNCSKKCNCQIDETKNHRMNFLGYQFEFPDVPNKKLKERSIKISISKVKINKIKSRIIYSLLSYISSKNFFLLKQRIQFLTSNYKVFENIPEMNLKAGIYYSYPLVNNFEPFDDLNLFLQKSICAKNKSFGNKLKNCLSQNQRDELRKLSFKRGSRERRMIDLTSEEIGLIKKCWTK